MHDVFDEYKIAFIEETEEHLETLNEDLISLEKNKGSKNRIDSTFRILHTLKSSAASVGFNDLSQFAHKAEDVVQEIRSSNQIITTEVVDLLFMVFDHIKLFIDHARENVEVNIDFTNVTNKLINTFNKTKNRKSRKVSNRTLSKKKTIQLTEKEKRLIRIAKKNNEGSYLIDVVIDPAEPIKWLRAELLVAHLLKIGEVIRLIPDEKTFQSETFTGKLYVIFITSQKPDEIHKVTKIDLVQIRHIELIQDVRKPINIQMQVLDNNHKNEVKSVFTDEPFQKCVITSNTVRVPVKKLDDLIHMVGELLVTNSGIKLLENRLKESLTDDSFMRELNLLTDKLFKISNSLQRGILKSRMIPIRTIFNQFTRVVRDLSIKDNKDIELIINSQETELDKKIIDTIGEPLTHLIRNAVDHGIEIPEVRKKLGKPVQAKIVLSASQVSNHIVISVKDDGRGIDLVKVKTKALEKGLLKKDSFEEVSDDHVISYIFKAGFSTTDKVSSVSGRGMGLDVVNNVITGLNGTVNVNSKTGQGTEFIITLPLTLAITGVIVVESGGNTYGIPVTDIRKFIKVNLGDIEGKTCIKALNINNKILPVFNLCEILEDKSSQISVDTHGCVSVIIVSYRDSEVGLIVDKIVGKQEIVLKPLEEHFKTIKGVSGAAIIGNGIVILVVDILNIIRIMDEV
jgi:two-component system chemotaxis sensor kinase CheA